MNTRRRKSNNWAIATSYVGYVNDQDFTRAGSLPSLLRPQVMKGRFFMKQQSCRNFSSSSKLSAAGNSIGRIKEYKILGYSAARVPNEQRIVDIVISGSFGNLMHSVATSKMTLCIGDGLCWIHDITGLDWYATIILSTVILRYILIGQAHVTSRKVKH